MVRPWLSSHSQRREADILGLVAQRSSDELLSVIDELVAENTTIHELESINLNPASNVMGPRAEAALSAGLSTRASLGHAGEKYEMGLEAVEQLEVITADLACRVFDSRFAELRPPSGAMANLFAFMACCQPGDSVIVPPATIGGHVTHNVDGAAGLYGLQIHEAPIDADRYTVDVKGVAELARKVRPTLISIGASLNLLPHPVRQLREIADEVGASLLFDAAHACGLFAGRQWKNPLDEGAHLMTMSTYKSLGGPAGGLIVTSDESLAERIDAIAYPGMTANFDVGRTTALAITLVDWLDSGQSYAAEMTASAAALAQALRDREVDVFETVAGPTTSHQFAVRADDGHATAARLRLANLLSTAIGLPDGSGVRFGTPEAVRWGMQASDMSTIADFIARALKADPATIANEVSDFRRRFDTVHFCSS